MSVSSVLSVVLFSGNHIHLPVSLVTLYTLSTSRLRPCLRVTFRRPLYRRQPARCCPVFLELKLCDSC